MPPNWHPLIAGRVFNTASDTLGQIRRHHRGTGQGVGHRDPAACARLQRPAGRRISPSTSPLAPIWRVKRRSPPPLEKAPKVPEATTKTDRLTQVMANTPRPNIAPDSPEAELGAFEERPLLANEIGISASYESR